ncbi:MAG: YceI family protein [Calditrichaeota bacterium]|nr:YceI family protein [Calditrichota bacterium]
MKFITAIYVPLFFIFSQTHRITNGLVRVSARSSVVGIEDEFDAVGRGLTGYIDYDRKLFHLVYDIWQLDTGIQLRNEHMHSNYLETENYPIAVYDGKITAIIADTIKVSGTFSLHGISKPLTVNAIRSKQQITAFWQLDITDYAIEIPSKFLIAKLNRVLKMSVELNLSQ